MTDLALRLITDYNVKDNSTRLRIDIKINNMQYSTGIVMEKDEIKELPIPEFAKNNGITGMINSTCLLLALEFLAKKIKENRT